MSKNTNLSFLTDYITADITNGRIGINNASPTVAFDVSGATKISGTLTLTSTISNGTYTYTLPSATGTLALTSALSGYLPLTGGTLTGALGGTSASFSSSVSSGTKFISSVGNNQIVFESLSATTGYQYIQLLNTTAHTIFGIEGTAAGSLLTGGLAYGSVFTSVGNTALQLGTNQTARLTITNAGNVGIGNSNPGSYSAPASQLVVGTTSGSNGITIVGGTTGFSNLYLADGTTGNEAFRGYIEYGHSADYMAFGTAAGERMRITSAGNVGIGTTSPSQKLEVIGTTKLSSAAGNITGINIIPGSVTNVFQTIGDGALGGRCFANIETGYANYDNASSSYMNFKTQSSPATTSDVSIVQMQIRPTGDIRMTVLSGSGTRTVVADANGQLSAPVSDVTLKENIIPIGYGLNEIMQMNPVWFNFIDGYKNYGEGRQNGNVAQEMVEIIPEAVFTTPQTGKMGINYEQLHAVYIKAIQELSAENTSLINRIEALENK
jgi:hypothetical protein